MRFPPLRRICGRALLSVLAMTALPALAAAALAGGSPGAVKHEGRFIELPLPQDCPSGDDPAACCSSGKLAGCEVMGRRSVVAGDWQAAARYYLTLCQAGVRAGCESLRTVYANGEDEDLPGKLLALCRRDGTGTHVACDVHATTNWAQLGLGAQLVRAAADADQSGSAADAPPTPSGAHPSNPR